MFVYNVNTYKHMYNLIEIAKLTQWHGPSPFCLRSWFNPFPPHQLLNQDEYLNQSAGTS